MCYKTMANSFSSQYGNCQSRVSLKRVIHIAIEFVYMEATRPPMFLKNVIITIVELLYMT